MAFVSTSFDRRAALLTGKYPQRVGLAGEEGTPRWIFLSLLSLYLVLFFFIVINCQGGYVCSGKGRLAVRYSNICLFGKVRQSFRPPKFLFCVNFVIIFLLVVVLNCKL